MIMGGMALRVVRATQSDSGEYTCLAVNRAGQSQVEATVEVKQRGNVLDTAVLNIYSQAASTSYCRNLTHTVS